MRKQIDHDTRVLILNDHYIDHLSYIAIARKRGLKSRTTVAAICQRTSKRAESNNISDLLKFADVNARSGRPTEHLHKDQKQLLHQFSITVTGAGATVKETAEIKMQHVRCANEEFEDCVRHRCTLLYIQGLCKRSKAADPPYSNRYRDSFTRKEMQVYIK
jgi:hypothetical protein